MWRRYPEIPALEFRRPHPLAQPHRRRRGDGGRSGDQLQGLPRTLRQPGHALARGGEDRHRISRRPVPAHEIDLGLPRLPGGCEVDFFVDFEFRNAILQGIIGMVFNDAMQRVVRAFERRAADCTGKIAAT
jgi:hypothetical protein